MKQISFIIFLVSSLAFGVVNNKVWRVPNGATLPAWGPINLVDNTNAITGLLPRANLPSLNYGLSNSSGTYNNSSACGTYATVTNQLITVTTAGRPVRAVAIGDNSGNFDVSTSLVGSAQLTIFRGSTQVQYMFVNNNSFAFAPHLEAFDAVSAGTYTYTIKACSNSGTSTINGFELLVYEID